MAHQTTINVNGQSVSVTEFDHTAQEIDDAVDMSLGGGVRPNLLDNWYFVGGGTDSGFPINQRGGTSWSTSGYTVDRWNKASGSNSTIQLEADGLTIAATRTGVEILRQIFDSATLNNILGRPITMSVLCENGLFKRTITLPESGSFDIGQTNISGTNIYFNVIGSSTSARFRFFSGGGSVPSTAKIYAAKLELGSGQTLARQDEDGNWQLYEIPDYTHELAKCQRYYYTFRDNSSRGVCFAGAVDGGGGSCFLYMPLGIQMRNTPTVSISRVLIHGAAGRIFDTNNSGDTFSVSETYVSGNGLILRISFSRNIGSADENITVRLVGQTTLSAEL